MTSAENHLKNGPELSDLDDIMRAMDADAPATQLAQQRTVADHDQPASDIERDIAAIWSELLHVTPIGRNDDFFALGGHSLMAMEILTKIRSRLGVELPLTALFSDTGFTVTELAKRVEVVLLEQASDEDIAGILADMPSEPHI
jgi:acyl carrier protein